MLWWYGDGETLKKIILFSKIINIILKNFYDRKYILFLILCFFCPPNNIAHTHETSHQSKSDEKCALQMVETHFQLGKLKETGERTKSTQFIIIIIIIFCEFLSFLYHFWFMTEKCTFQIHYFLHRLPRSMRTVLPHSLPLPSRISLLLGDELHSVVSIRETDISDQEEGEIILFMKLQHALIAFMTWH